MNLKGGKADASLIATVLTACSQLTTVQPGSEIHGYAFRRGYHLEVMVSSALVDMPLCMLSCWSCREYVRRMKDQFGISANTEHYVYMVKLLGMEGQLREAYELVQSLQEPVDSGIWGALLSCCDAHRNYELADIVAYRLFGDKLENGSYRVMLLNMYASDGRWYLVNKLRVESGLTKLKLPGKNWITSKKHSF
ncbi:hypothetical protein K7X08_024601 [Anisodus acutangulus]|uniref:Pentatricopeptide repeat-containing protein n=1 Tax=Anisodus acutangulus TaxID=402998 RepID=A0A9Q1M952_9SOLA|nr:hypothetical protein K7X08_024601 [Anisodus acutangulus]